ncbi:hypothetical protein H6P81_009990 [Aristolochia fimbriata]|uniref:Uncharacterized protein n=1 Tax=Aristolochia fimbriata TaxID=158543 RepID=A0AAV7EPJ0_ARIFI|nr:hypothetical protein H6P81_009990 [Aristolochia fimbriata]
MGEDPQRIKKIAAASFDYEGDPRWADYWSNILIPPHMVSRSDVVDHFKHKFYQRYIDPDFVVEPMSSTSTSQPTRPSAASSARPSSASSASSASQQTRPRDSGSSTGTSAQPDTGAGSLRWDRPTIQFSVNAWVFIVAVLAIFPLVPRNLSQRAYRLSLIGTLCSSLYSLYSLYGKPRAWNLQGIQMWLQSVIATKDFIHFLYCLTFVSSQMHIKFALIPVLCRSLEYVAKFLRRNFARSSLYRKYLEDGCLWVETNSTTLSILSSNAEVGLGFLLIFSLFSWQRNIIQTFMYWQLLKLMYHAPVTASYHQNVWTKIGRSVTPLIHRYAPFLNTPLPNEMEANPLPEQQQQQQQQQAAFYQQASSNGYYHASGSVGPFFAMFSVVMVLAAISCLIGRVYSRRLESTDTNYDCSSCHWGRLCTLRPMGLNFSYGCMEWLRSRCRCCMGRDVEVGSKVMDSPETPTDR